MRAVRWVLLTSGGLGCGWPPGSLGSLPPPLAALGLVWLGAGVWAVNAALAGLALVFGVACVTGGAWAEENYGGKDPRQVVADETAGQSIALLFLPWREAADADRWTWNLLLAGTAFGAFRLFDVAKPPPIHQVQRVSGGWGILLDDLIAGLFALGTTHLLAWLLWPHLL